MKNVLVTGAAKRLGRAIALDLAAAGWNVAIHYNGSEEDADSAAQAARAFGADAATVSDILDDLLQTPTVELQEAAAVRDAVLRYRQGGVDLHDCLIVALAATRKARVLTFDAKAARRLGMELLR